MSLKETLNEETIKIDAKIKEFFDEYLNSGMLPHDFVVQFYSDLKNYLLLGGKRLRPISIVMMYKGLGGLSDDIYNMAISVELLHNASLVHDDIIDHDVIRRGQPSFHAFYGNWFEKNLKQYSDQTDFGLAMGILGGDLLIDLGQEAILKSNFNTDEKMKALTYYLMAYKELIHGVTAESYLQSLPLDKVSENDYLTMINGKTGALFQKSLLIGAVLAEETEKCKKEISEFGTLLGQAFQIRDDILGTFGDPEETGKSTESDIREGKKTLLAIYGTEDPQIIELYGKKDLTRKEIQTVKHALKDVGSLERAKEKALNLSESAKDVLRKIDLNEKSMNFFMELVNFVQERIV
jgi:geranylgeranyl pyrophosphate synthase